MMVILKLHALLRDGSVSERGFNGVAVSTYGECRCPAMGAAAHTRLSISLANEERQVCVKEPVSVVDAMIRKAEGTVVFRDGLG